MNKRIFALFRTLQILLTLNAWNWPILACCAFWLGLALFLWCA